MKKINKKYEKYVYAGVTAFLVLVGFSALKMLMDYIGPFGEYIAAVNSALFPVYVGIIIAYLLSPLIDKMDSFVTIPLVGKLVKKPTKAKGIARVISVFVILILALIVIFGLIILVVPEVLNSITRLLEHLPGYYQNLLEWGKGVFKSNEMYVDFFQKYSGEVYTKLFTWLQDVILPSGTMLVSVITDSVVSAVTVLVEFFIGIIISIYMMVSKERFCGQLKKLLYTIFSVGHANSMLSVFSETHGIFAKFISGKIVDSLIVGILTFIIMSIAGIPYTLLISVIIGVTNLIPFFGQYLGIVPSAILVFIAAPGKGILFLVLIILLMQFDGNVLGPKILGDSIGLKSFWILFSILLFGSLFGVLGMLCAVPVFAIIYRLLKRWSAGRLAKKQLPTETEYYSNIKKL